MDTISQRELRNDNARVMRAVEDGESFLVTRRGVPVARLVPAADGEPDLRCARPASTRPQYADHARVRTGVPTEEILDDLRGGR